MTGEILTLNDQAAWHERLAQTGLGDVYYHPAYLAALAARGEGEPALFVYQSAAGAGVHAVLRRPLRSLSFSHPFGDFWDAATPYGYAGPQLTNPQLAREFWPAWQEAARRLGIIAEFIRFHPLFANHEPWAGLVATRRAGRTIWMDLTGDFEADCAKSRRRDARYAQRQGVVVERAGAEHLPAFTAMYQATMARREAEPYYFFDLNYFQRLADGLGDDFWLLRAHLRGRDCAYALCLRHGGILHYHLNGSDEAMGEYRAVSLLLLEAARLGQAAGVRRFHLGGGYQGEDSLFAFKSHFSPHRADFYIGTAVHDEKAVSRLTELARATGCAPSDPAFFPPYRRRR